MLDEYKGVLEKFGFDVNTKGFVLFADVTQEIQQLFNEGKTEEEIRELLPSYYLEHYHFIHEIGRNKYFEELKTFCNTRKVPEKQEKLTGKEFGSLPKTGLDDAVIFFAKYFNSQSKGEFDGKKVFVKSSKSIEIKNV